MDLMSGRTALLNAAVIRPRWLMNYTSVVCLWLPENVDSVNQSGVWWCEVEARWPPERVSAESSYGRPAPLIRN